MVTPPVSVVSDLIPVKVLPGELHVSTELPDKVCHECGYGADTLEDTVTAAINAIRLCGRRIEVKVFLQHLCRDPEYMTDTETSPVVHQDIVQHPAYVIQLFLRIGCDRLIVLKACIVLETRKPHDNAVPVADYEE